MVCEAEGRYDLRSRTRKYASNIVQLYCNLPKGRREIAVIGEQLLRAGTSVAANYRESCRSRSCAEFISKIETCAQEADESDLWLDMLKNDCGIETELIEFLLKETDELIAIFVTMSKNTKKRSDYKK
ncbi:MAG: four helix bundle protein [Candidatus Pacebacteria bacterium]|nr:four helix bundle protein [Candidatus Paceibacterota bacterium]